MYAQNYLTPLLVTIASMIFLVGVQLATPMQLEPRWETLWMQRRRAPPVAQR